MSEYRFKEDDEQTGASGTGASVCAPDAAQPSAVRAVLRALA